jgi:hypothetical protein
MLACGCHWNQDNGIHNACNLLKLKLNE